MDYSSLLENTLTSHIVHKFAADTKQWMHHYKKAFEKMVTAGVECGTLTVPVEYS